VAERRAYAAHAAGRGLVVPKSARGPVDHIAFDAPDYDAVTERLERKGVGAVRNTVHGSGPRQLFIEDPNGVLVEINVKASDDDGGRDG